MDNKIKVYSASSLMDRVVKDYEKKESAAKRVSIKKGNIVIKVSEGYDYEIPVDDCRTVRGALNWIEHMSEKTWVSKHLLWCIAEAIRQASDMPPKICNLQDNDL